MYSNYSIDSIQKLIEQRCDPKKYGNVSKYPFINYLPFTAPSKKFVELVKKLESSRNANWEQPNDDIQTVRDKFAEFKLEKTGAIQDPSLCALSKHTFSHKTNDGNQTSTYYKVQYKGSSIKNGAIIEVHGGCYCLCDARMHHAFAEMISKVTGCVVFQLDYKLCPEHPLPYCVNELIALYSKLLNDFRIPSDKIAMTGASAGGGMVLLALQKIKKMQMQIQLPQPCCVWLNSPWTNLANNSKSYVVNADIESIMGYPLLDTTADWCVGNKDGKLNVIADNNKMDRKYSPLFGDFKGLCPMYFTVAANEVMLDDSVNAAIKAYEQGCDVRCDINPYMMHIWPILFGIIGSAFPESIHSVAIACDWFLRKFKQKQISKL